MLSSTTGTPKQLSDSAPLSHLWLGDLVELNCCDASSRMSSSESVPGSVLSRSSALSHHPLGLNKSMRLRVSRDSHQNAPQPVDKRSQRRAG